MQYYDISKNKLPTDSEIQLSDRNKIVAVASSHGNSSSVYLWFP